MSEESNNAEGVFSRWSRRKLQKQTRSDNNLQEEVVAELASDSSTAIESETDTETAAKRSEEIKVEPPIWQQEDADPERKQQALAALFRQPEFKEVDHMNEYDEDFTQFDSLGDIVTEEMKRMLKLAEEKTRPAALDEAEKNIENIKSASDETDEQQEKEDNNLA